MESSIKIISSSNHLKYLNSSLTELEIIDLNSDLKHRVFPRPFERLSNLRGKTNLVGVEIGVCGAEHALSLLETFDISTLYLVDPYDMYETYTEGEGKNYGDTQLALSETFLEAKKLLEPFKKNIEWVKKKSEDAVTEIKKNIDFVYVDGNHDYQFVKKDIELYYPIIKIGGMMGGHDFYNGHAQTHNGVVKAVTEFAVSKGIQLYVEQPDWWFYKS